MEILRNWIIMIVSVIIFASFIEMLLPNSSNRRYVNAVIGILIIIIILHPILNLIKYSTINLEEKILQIDNEIELNTIKNRNKISDYQKSNILGLYKEQLSQQISNRIHKLWGYRVIELNLTIDEGDTDNFGMIQGLELNLTDGNKEEVHSSTNDIKPISIDVTSNKKNNNMKTHDGINIKYKSKKIADDLSQLYDLSTDKIDIYIHADE